MNRRLPPMRLFTIGTVVAVFDRVTRKARPKRRRKGKRPDRPTSLERIAVPEVSASAPSPVPVPAPAPAPADAPSDLGVRMSSAYARLALFVIFAWFGLLKIIDHCPAKSLIFDLVDRTAPFVPKEGFLILLGILEMSVGIVFLIRGIERFALALLFFHMMGAALPLLFVPTKTWDGALLPTMEGQYVIKNLAIIGLGIMVYVNARSVRTAPSVLSALLRFVPKRVRPRLERESGRGAAQLA